jgi:hypothetical protein
VVAGSFQSVVEAELQKPKHSLAREKEVGSRAHDQTLRGPTLTEWGLIALAVLLAGGMGYMIYRRRPALRPAAP